MVDEDNHAADETAEFANDSKDAEAPDSIAADDPHKAEKLTAPHVDGDLEEMEE